MLRIGLVLLLSLFSACALSPQQVTINPTVDTAVTRFGSGQLVQVTVEDLRESKVIGSRGGIYKETSVITIANDITAAIAKAVEATLAMQGFNIAADDQQASAHVNVVIKELSYTVPKQTIGKKLSLNAALMLKASSQGETYKKGYESTRNWQGAVSPSEANNERMINGLLSDILLRMFSDEKLQAFLSNI